MKKTMKWKTMEKKLIDDGFEDNDVPVSPTNILLVRQIKMSGWVGET